MIKNPLARASLTALFMFTAPAAIAHDAFDTDREEVECTGQGQLPDYQGPCSNPVAFK